MSSEISGELPMDYQSRIGDIIYHLTPAGQSPVRQNQKP